MEREEGGTQGGEKKEQGAEEMGEVDMVVAGEREERGGRHMGRADRRQGKLGREREKGDRRVRERGG